MVKISRIIRVFVPSSLSTRSRIRETVKSLSGALESSLELDGLSEQDAPSWSAFFLSRSFSDSFMNADSVLTLKSQGRSCTPLSGIAVSWRQVGQVKTGISL